MLVKSRPITSSLRRMEAKKDGAVAPTFFIVAAAVVTLFATAFAIQNNWLSSVPESIFNNIRLIASNSK